MKAMHVLSAAEMQACDRATTERYGVPSILLMRAAAAAVADFAREQYPQARRVTVLCGRGNNGGDGMMAARLLSEAGLDVSTLLLGDPRQLTGDAAQAWQEIDGASQVHCVTVATDLARYRNLLDADLILDAVLGTGFKPPMKGLALAALDWMRAASKLPPILAVDLPSGWPADAATAVEEDVYPADAVVTFTAPKPAHVFGELTRRWNQPIVVAPIGSPDAAIVSSLGMEWAGSSLSIAQRPRAATANKGNFGHVLVVGASLGSAGGKAGAPAMTAMAALRAGAGLVTAAVPAPALQAVGSFAPELMTWPLSATAKGEIAGERNLTPVQIAALIKGKTVLAIGPGMGQSAETAKFVTGLLAATQMPAVIDADALNILAMKAALLPKIAKKGKRTVVLTPHPGEMARLAKLSVAEVQADRLGIARSFAEKNGVTLVLKGARTIIAHPNGRVAVNTSGNPGMAKGGSGDVLTGLIAGMLAQHADDAQRAVEAAVYLHGLAADFAVAESDEHTLLATDCLSYLARAYQCRLHELGGNGNRTVWLQGAPRNLREEPRSSRGEEA